MQTTPTMPTMRPPAQEPVAPDPELQRREQAIKRLQDKNGFKIHLVAYLLINAWLVAMWAITGAGYFWPIYVMVAWGGGVVVHGYATYGGRRFTEAQIQREMKSMPSDGGSLSQ